MIRDDGCPDRPLGRPARCARRLRRGAATVEFALAAPLLLLFFFAAFEFTRVNNVQHTVDIAAYEGARRGVLPGATAQQVQTRVASVLNTTGVTNATVSATVGTNEVTVNITIPASANSWLANRFCGSRTIQRSYTLKRERGQDYLQLAQETRMFIFSRAQIDARD